jgi:hypothetical protein
MFQATPQGFFKRFVLAIAHFFAFDQRHDIDRSCISNKLSVFDSDDLFAG